MECIHCGKCTRSCAFLGKYGLDLEGFSRRPELAYHCFLCGECARNCPRGIDGRAIALDMRRERVEAAGGEFSRLSEYRPLRPLIWEKRRYIFRSYRRAAPGAVLFPGCNFPSFFPETTKKLIALLRARAGIGVVMDCCGKPIYELGMERERGRIALTLAERLHRRGVTELVALCPNCYYYLKSTLDIPVVSIYRKLRELGLAQVLEAERFRLYIPCPDRAAREICGSLAPLLHGEVQEVRDIQCCGLGGCAAPFEGELSASFGERLKSGPPAPVYTYCASCAGKLSRGGADVRHVLPELLGVEETPARGPASLANRAKFKLL